MKLKTLAIGIASAVVIIPGSKIGCDVASTYQTQLQTMEINGQYFGWWGQEQTQKVYAAANNSAYVGAGIGATTTAILAFIFYLINERNHRNDRSRTSRDNISDSSSAWNSKEYESS